MDTRETPRTGGSKELFTRANSNAHADMRWLRAKTEEAQANARDRTLTRWERQQWLELSDLFERMLDLRLAMAQRQNQSHDKIVSRNPCGMCRQYTRVDTSMEVLKRMALGEPEPAPVPAGVG